MFASEDHLAIPEELIAVEEERILEETRDVENRSTSAVNSWSQFRSAWNSSSTTVISLNASVDYGSGGLFTSLNTRSNSIIVQSSTSRREDLGVRTETLKMSGSSNLTFSSMQLLGNSFSSDYTVNHSGSGKVIYTDTFENTNGSSVQAQNILIESGSVICGIVNLTNQGTLEIFSNGSTRLTGIRNTGLNYPSELRTTGSGHNIYIRGNDFLAQGTNLNTRTWSSVNLHLSGTTTSAINSAITSPDDFSERYLGMNSTQQTIVLNGRAADIGWVDPPVPTGEVIVEYQDTEGTTLSENEVLSGPIGEDYLSTAKDIQGYTLTEVPENATGVFTTLPISVTYVYEEETVVSPVDPLYPETDVDPENPPVLPENQDRLSIDFASQFNFGSQHISVQDKNYYAHPQRLLNEDGTVNEQEKRPNYVQISDRRSETDRNGWQLSVTQNSQFSTENGKELSGARMRLTNQQLATAHGGTAPSLQQTEPLELVPGAKRVLLMAQGNEGTGTWIYRFGDANTAGNSVVLDVPKGANPEATSYSSTFTWELSVVPEN